MRKTGLQVENLVVVFTASISDSVVKGVGMEWCFSQLFLISLETQYWFRMDESLPPLFCSVLSCSCNQSAENHSTAPPILFPPTLLFINKINRISAEKNIGSPLPPSHYLQQAVLTEMVFCSQAVVADRGNHPLPTKECYTRQPKISAESH